MEDMNYFNQMKILGKSVLSPDSTNNVGKP